MPIRHAYNGRKAHYWKNVCSKNSYRPYVSAPKNGSMIPTSRSGGLKSGVTNIGIRSGMYVLTVIGRYECGIIEEGPGFFRCAFLTAWAPPIAGFDALRTFGFETEAMYLELGSCSSGIYRFGHNYCDSAVPSDMLKVF